jgi:hypothetical protein
MANPGAATRQLSSVNRPRTNSKSAMPMTRITVNLSIDLVDRLRNTVYGISHLTLSGLVAGAIGTALSQFEAEHGGRFPRRARELQAGRPRKRASGQPDLPSAMAQTSRPTAQPCLLPLNPIHHGQEASEGRSVRQASKMLQEGVSLSKTV